MFCVIKSINFFVLFYLI